MKQIIVLLFLLSFEGFAIGQNSFQLSHFFNSSTTSSTGGITSFSSDYIATSTEEFLTLGHFYSSHDEYVCIFKNDGTFIEGSKIHLDEAEGNWMISGESSNDSLVAYISERFQEDALIVFNKSSKEAWAKSTIVGGPNLSVSPKNTGISNGNIIVNSSSSIQQIGGMDVELVLRCMSSSGTPIWNYAYSFEEHLWFRNMKTLPNGNILVLTDYGGADTALLLEINAQGEVINTLVIDSITPREITIAASGNIYILGKNQRIPPDNSPGWSNNAAIIKLSPNFELLWSKEIILEQLRSRRISVFEKSNNNLVISYSGVGKLPISIFELTETNEILWQKGYAFPSVEMVVLQDDSVVFFSGNGHTIDNGYDSRFTLARTNEDASFDNCPSYTTCIDVNNFGVDLSSANFAYQEDPHILPPFNISVEPITWEFEDFCNTPPAPTPDFLYPDTICLDACTTPDSLQNYFAHHQEWTITAPDGTDTLITEKVPEYCFDQEGTYLIEQVIWFLGCDYYYEQSVAVVPAMDISLGDDDINCNALPYELTLQSNRPITTYEWSDGSTGFSIELTTSGTYWVAARGPYCEAVERDTITIEFIEDYVDEPVFTLPSDTSICVQHYPYVVAPESAFAQSYTLDGEQALAPSHALTQAGTYVFSTTIEGCVFSDSIQITTNDCQASIYLSNVFSPNFDGINDTWAPQGIDFELISIEVFDRWGNLLAYPQGKDALWDGRNATNGVYVIQIRYRNLLSNQVETITKDVMVMR